MSKRFSGLALALLIAVLLTAGCQQTASYPTKGIEYVVHSSAGGGSDIMARSIAEILSKEKLVTQPITVVNKTGGSGAVASAYVAEKKGDPYFLYNVTSVQSSTPITGGSKVFLKDLTPLVQLSQDSNAVAVRADSPYKTLKDLTDASKTKKLNQGGGSITSDENTTGFSVKKATGAQWEFVSFNSGGEAVTALLGGQVDLTCNQPVELVEQVRAGKIRILAVNSDQRLAAWPDAPTLKELGIPNPGGTFRGVYMPAGVPAEAVTYWEGVFGKMVKTDAWKKYLTDNLQFDAFKNGKDFQAVVDKFEKDAVSTMTEMGVMKK